jgi:hypothetical protein
MLQSGFPHEVRMPCLELKVVAEPPSNPATRLRTLLEKPGAAVLRRNSPAESNGHEDEQASSRFRVVAVLAVDLCNPPQEPESAPAEEAPAEGDEPGDNPVTIHEDDDPFAGSFAKGLEIWVADGVRATCIYVDADEIQGALSMFDAYLRLARFQPAFLRLDQRSVGLHFSFREGLTVAVNGAPSPIDPATEVQFEGVSPIAEVDDFRAPSFVVRLPNGCIQQFHDRLRTASVWLEENSYTNILGSK